MIDTIARLTAAGWTLTIWPTPGNPDEINAYAEKTVDGRLVQTTQRKHSIKDCIDREIGSVPPGSSLVQIVADDAMADDVRRGAQS